VYCLDTTPLSNNLNPGALAWSKCQEFMGKTTSQELNALLYSNQL